MIVVKWQYSNGQCQQWLQSNDHFQIIDLIQMILVVDKLLVPNGCNTQMIVVKW
jgi:hypothetical protein